MSTIDLVNYFSNKNNNRDGMAICTIDYFSLIIHVNK